MGRKPNTYALKYQSQEPKQEKVNILKDLVNLFRQLRPSLLEVRDDSPMSPLLDK